LLQQAGDPAPRVVATQRAGGDTGGVVEISFSQAMDQGKTAAALKVTGPGGRVVDGKVTWPAPDRLLFIPSLAMEPAATYQVHLDEGASSATGVAMKETLRFDLQPPAMIRVAQVFPADGTQEVAVDGNITVMFSRPVVPLRIAEEQINLPNPLRIQPEVAGKGEWVNTSVYVFDPDQPLSGATTYTVTIPAGLADMTGDSAALKEDFTFSFTTRSPSVDRLWVRINDAESREITADGQTADIPLQPNFSLLFLQPMDRDSTEAALTLESASGASIPLILTWNEEGKTLFFNPTQRLALGQRYQIKLATSAQSVDGSPMLKEQNWSVVTVMPPEIVSTSPVDGASNAPTVLEIQFASPMNIKSVTSRVSFSPALERDTNWYYDEYRNRLVFYGLANSTSYTVRFASGMTDIYGNPIREERTIQFTTEPAPRQAWMMIPDRALFRSGAEDTFYTRMTNLSSATFSLYRLDLSQVVQISKQGYWDYRPAKDQLLWKQEISIDAAQDETKLIDLPLSGPEGGSLEHGFYLLGMNAPEIPTTSIFTDARMVLVADANLVLKVSTGEALAWVTGLESGQPIQDLTVTLYDAGNKRVGEANTGADGLARVELPSSVASTENFYAIVDGGGHFAYAESYMGSGVSAYDFGIFEQYYESPRSEVVYTYTDRPIYRPGQPVYFKGILRQDDDLTYSLPSQGEVQIKIRSFGEDVYTTNLPVSEWGTFNGEFLLDSEAVLGAYTLEVYLPGADEPIGWVSFNVAEYRRPEFQVTVTAAPADVLKGEAFSANLKAEYYSGGGVADAQVEWTLRSSPFYYTPPAKYGQYSFTDYDRDDFYAFYRYSGQNNNDNLLAEGTAVTDANGLLTLSLPVELKTDASQTLTLETTVGDFAGTYVSARTGVVAHRSGVYPGLRFDGYLGQAGKEQMVHLLALDWDGAPVAGQLVDVQVVERRWNSVQEQDEYGNIKWTSSVEEIPVAEFKEVALDENGEGSVSFIPPNGGVFKAIITARDERGNLATVSAILWVAGEEYIPWQQTNNRAFQLVANQSEYRPGDTAEILIASPFQGANYALVTVERGRIRHQEVILLESNSTLYQLPITADMAPGVYLSVVVIKGVSADSPRPNFKIGMAEIKVNTEYQELQVSVTADRDDAGPGDQVTYTVSTTDLSGQPVAAEVSLGLSDLATLSLLPPNAPTILSGFYERRGLRVRTATALVNSIEDYNATLADYVEAQGERAGSGGGKGDEGLGVVEIRQDFPDTAFWRADVRTDENGKAQVTVRLPDNLTTWRMDARAVTQDTRVGQTTMDLVSSKPLLLRPQTPRFFVAGDQVSLGTAIHNNTPGALDVQASLEGDGFDLAGEAEQTVSIPAGQRAYVSWQVRVAEDARFVDLVFKANGGGYSDASRPTIGSAGAAGLPVYRYEVPESVAASGQLSEQGTQVEAILLPQDMKAGQAELTVSVSPSLSAGMVDGLTYLEHYPYECTEQTVSRFLPNVLVTRVLQEAGTADPQMVEKLEEQVNLAVQRLASWQNEDGGWGWWRNGTSDEQVSAYVVLGLIEAGDAGYEVPAAVLASGIQYLAAQVTRLTESADLGSEAQANRQMFMLYVLTRGGRPVPSLVQRLFEDRLRLDLYARALMARTIAMQDPQDPRLDTLRSDFASEAVLSASGAHWEETERDRWNWNSDTRTTAIMLGTLVAIDPENPLTANTVRWLMNHRVEGRWASTQETAWSLMALADWMRVSGELKPNYRYAVGFNDQVMHQATVTTETVRETWTGQAELAAMLADEANRLAFARDAGAGTLYYTADLKVWLPVPQVKALDRGIILSRSYYRLDDPAKPVTQAAPGEVLRAKITVIAPTALHYVLIDDPLPAGLEGIDTSLQTSPQGELPEASRWDDWDETGWGWWYYDHIQMYDEKVVFSADYLPAGTYTYTYLVRAGLPGVYNVIPPTAQEFYFPDVYGRGDGMQFEVKE